MLPVLFHSPRNHGTPNVTKEDNSWGLPFHPTCFEIFKIISKDRFGKVDLHGLWKYHKACHDI